MMLILQQSVSEIFKIQLCFLKALLISFVILLICIPFLKSLEYLLLLSNVSCLINACSSSCPYLRRLVPEIFKFMITKKNIWGTDFDISVLQLRVLSVSRKRISNNDRANNEFDLLIHESLLILRDRPSLNSQQSSIPLALF